MDQYDRRAYDLSYQAELAANSEPVTGQDPDGLPMPFSLSAVFDNPPQLSPPVIEGVLRQGHKMLLSGPSKAGKSFALMELCIAIAEGMNWFGNRCKKGKVLYINMEIDRRSCINRIKKIYEAYSHLFEAQNTDNITIWSLRGYARPISQLKDKIIETAKNDYVAIVLDPLYKVMEGDENSNADVSKMVAFFDEITEKTGASMIYAHHFAKGNSGDKDVIDRAAGAGTFARDADALVTLTQLDTDNENGDTAWRTEYVIREFPPKKPYDVWFRYPLHEFDDDLKTETIITSETKKQKRRDAASHQKKDKTTEDILGVIENVSDSEGKFLFSRFYNFYQGVEKVSDPTARSRLKALGYYPDENCPPGGTPYWRKKE